MRAFVAIELPDHVREELETLQQGLAIGRLVPEENLHLTLSFLGEQPVEAIHEAHQALSFMRARVFELQLVGVGSFGGRSPHVVFADVLPCDALSDLEQRIVRTLRSAGLDFQKRRFRPHVTIARLKKSLPAHDLARLRDFLSDHAGFRGTRFRVENFALYRSTLRPEAVLHEAIASYDLIDT